MRFNVTKRVIVKSYVTYFELTGESKVQRTERAPAIPKVLQKWVFSPHWLCQSRDHS